MSCFDHYKEKWNNGMENIIILGYNNINGRLSNESTTSTSEKNNKETKGNILLERENKWELF